MTNTQEIDSLFYELEKKLYVRSPQNLKEEKIKFFNSGNTYNPQFNYHKDIPQIDYAPISNRIDLISSDPLKQLYQAKLKEYQKKEKLVHLIGVSASDFTQACINLYGKPTKKLVAIAHKIVAYMPEINLDKKNPSLIRFTQLKKQIVDHLIQSGLEGKLVIRDSKGVQNHVSISKISGNLNLSRNYMADQDELTDIIYHELETHMRRLENAKNLPHSIFVLGTAGYLAYEEGLATLTGHSRKSNKNLWHPALLLIAMDTAMSQDFVTVFKTINTIIKSPIRSWTYAVRVKNGLSDTSKPGAFTKDLYLKWLVKAGKELINHEKLLNVAYNGKASFEELALMSQPRQNPHGISVDQIKTIFKENFISYA